MDEKFRYKFKWEMEDFTTTRTRIHTYNKKFWPLEGIDPPVFDPFGKKYNPSCIVFYESEGNAFVKEERKFYLKFDGALPKDFRVEYSCSINTIKETGKGITEYLYSREEKRVEHGRVFLFSVFIKGATLRIGTKVLGFSREHDYIAIEFTFKMYFCDSVLRKRRTITPAINVPRKRRCNICSDFKNLYDSKEMADVTITVDGVCLLAHKLVLVTHSPIFKAMFDNDCLESNTKTIQITDVDASTFDNFLRCLYCSEIGDKSYDMVRNLYVLADKYAVDALKEDCRNILQSELNEGTVCQLLEMSYLFMDETLKGKAVDFFKQHFSAVSEKPEWFKICEDHPKMASDVLRTVT
nr:TD and POZ domain-containing protein 3-like [Parasteatoda tepidariorum]